MKNNEKSIPTGIAHKIRELEQEKILLSGLHDLLNQKYVKMDELCEIIAHEFRTPLVPVKAYLEMVLGEKFGELTEKQKEKLYVVHSNIEQISELISDILESKKIELGKFALQKMKISLNHLIENSINTLQHVIKERNIRMSYNCDPITLTCDPDKISKVLTKLIKNSLDPSTCSDELEIHVHDRKNEIGIIVRDNGIGIPHDKQKDLFKKFDQVDMSSIREKYGVGLSLYLSNQIITLHGGNMQLVSNTGKGTTVHITLPKSEE